MATSQTQTNLYRICDDCGSPIIGQVCRNCGLTINEPEFKGDVHRALTFDKDHFPHANSFGHWGHLLTNECGNTFPAYERQQDRHFYRLVKLDRSRTFSFDRQMVITLSRWNIQLGLSKERLREIMIEHKYMRAKHQIRNNVSLLASLVWQNLRHHQSPLRFLELCQITHNYGNRYSNKLLVYDVRDYNLKIKKISKVLYLTRYLSVLEHSQFRKTLLRYHIEPLKFTQEIWKMAYPICAKPLRTGSNPYYFVLGVIYGMILIYEKRHLYPKLISQTETAKIFNVLPWILRDTWATIRLRHKSYLEGLCYV